MIDNQMTSVVPFFPEEEGCKECRYTGVVRNWDDSEEAPYWIPCECCKEKTNEND